MYILPLDIFKGELHPNQNLACFALYFKIVKMVYAS